MSKSLYKNITPNIPNFSHYSIQSDGRLYSDYSGDWKEVKPVRKGTGYISNNLVSDSGKRKNVYRHRLVALTYIPNPEHKPMVCHKDNNPLNNHKSNLYWGTGEDNMGQCIQDSRFYAIGTHRKLLKAKQVNFNHVISDYVQGLPRKEILAKYNISTGYLYKILRTQNIPLRHGRKEKPK